MIRVTATKYVYFLTHASHVEGVFNTIHICWTLTPARNFKHQAPNISDTTRAAILGAKLEYQALNIHIRARVKHEVYNVTFQAFRPRLQRQTPAMSDPKLSVRDCNIKPQQY